MILAYFKENKKVNVEEISDEFINKYVEENGLLLEINKEIDEKIYEENYNGHEKKEIEEQKNNLKIKIEEELKNKLKQLIKQYGKNILQLEEFYEKEKDEINKTVEKYEANRSFDNETLKFIEEFLKEENLCEVLEYNIKFKNTFPFKTMEKYSCVVDEERIKEKIKNYFKEKKNLVSDYVALNRIADLIYNRIKIIIANKQYLIKILNNFIEKNLEQFMKKLEEEKIIKLKMKYVDKEDFARKVLKHIWDGYNIFSNQNKITQELDNFYEENFMQNYLQQYKKELLNRIITSLKEHDINLEEKNNVSLEYLKNKKQSLEYLENKISFEILLENLVTKGNRAEFDNKIKEKAKEIQEKYETNVEKAEEEFPKMLEKIIEELKKEGIIEEKIYCSEEYKVADIIKTEIENKYKIKNKEKEIKNDEELNSLHNLIFNEVVEFEDEMRKNKIEMFLTEGIKEILEKLKKENFIKFKDNDKISEESFVNNFLKMRLKNLNWNMYEIRKEKTKDFTSKIEEEIKKLEENLKKLKGEEKKEAGKLDILILNEFLKGAYFNDGYIVRCVNELYNHKNEEEFKKSFLNIKYSPDELIKQLNNADVEYSRKNTEYYFNKPAANYKKIIDIAINFEPNKDNKGFKDKFSDSMKLYDIKLILKIMSSLEEKNKIDYVKAERNRKLLRNKEFEKTLKNLTLKEIDKIELKYKSAIYKAFDEYVKRYLNYFIENLKNNGCIFEDCENFYLEFGNKQLNLLLEEEVLNNSFLKTIVSLLTMGKEEDFNRIKSLVKNLVVAAVLENVANAQIKKNEIYIKTAIDELLSRYFQSCNGEGNIKKIKEALNNKKLIDKNNYNIYLKLSNYKQYKKIIVEQAIKKNKYLQTIMEITTKAKDKNYDDCLEELIYNLTAGILSQLACEEYINKYRNLSELSPDENNQKMEEMSSKLKSFSATTMDWLYKKGLLNRNEIYKNMCNEEAQKYMDCEIEKNEIYKEVVNSYENLEKNKITAMLKNIIFIRILEKTAWQEFNKFEFESEEIKQKTKQLIKEYVERNMNWIMNELKNNYKKSINPVDILNKERVEEYVKDNAQDNEYYKVIEYVMKNSYAKLEEILKNIIAKTKDKNTQEYIDENCEEYEKIKRMLRSVILASIVKKAIEGSKYIESYTKTLGKYKEYFEKDLEEFKLQLKNKGCFNLDKGCFYLGGTKLNYINLIEELEEEILKKGKFDEIFKNINIENKKKIKAMFKNAVFAMVLYILNSKNCIIKEGDKINDENFLNKIFKDYYNEDLNSKIEENLKEEGFDVYEENAKDKFDNVLLKLSKEDEKNIYKKLNDITYDEDNFVKEEILRNYALYCLEADELYNISLVNKDIEKLIHDKIIRDIKSKKIEQKNGEIEKQEYEEEKNINEHKNEEKEFMLTYLNYKNKYFYNFVKRLEYGGCIELYGDSNQAKINLEKYDLVFEEEFSESSIFKEYLYDAAFKAKIREKLLNDVEEYIEFKNTDDYDIKEKICEIIIKEYLDKKFLTIFLEKLIKNGIIIQKNGAYELRDLAELNYEIMEEIKNNPIFEITRKDNVSKKIIEDIMLDIIMSKVNSKEKEIENSTEIKLSDKYNQKMQSLKEEKLKHLSISYYLYKNECFELFLYMLLERGILYFEKDKVLYEEKSLKLAVEKEISQNKYLKHFSILKNVFYKIIFNNIVEDFKEYVNLINNNNKEYVKFNLSLYYHKNFEDSLKVLKEADKKIIYYDSKNFSFNEEVLREFFGEEVNKNAYLKKCDEKIGKENVIKMLIEHFKEYVKVKGLDYFIEQIVLQYFKVYFDDLINILFKNNTLEIRENFISIKDGLLKESIEKELRNNDILKIIEEQYYNKQMFDIALKIIEAKVKEYVKQANENYEKYINFMFNLYCNENLEQFLQKNIEIEESHKELLKEKGAIIEKWLGGKLQTNEKLNKNKNLTIEDVLKDLSYENTLNSILKDLQALKKKVKTKDAATKILHDKFDVLSSLLEKSVKLLDCEIDKEIKTNEFLKHIANKLPKKNKVLKNIFKDALLKYVNNFEIIFSEYCKQEYKNLAQQCEKCDLIDPKSFGELKLDETRLLLFIYNELTNKSSKFKKCVDKCKPFKRAMFKKLFYSIKDYIEFNIMPNPENIVSVLVETYKKNNLKILIKNLEKEKIMFVRTDSYSLKEKDKEKEEYENKFELVDVKKLELERFIEGEIETDEYLNKYPKGTVFYNILKEKIIKLVYEYLESIHSGGDINKPVLSYIVDLYYKNNYEHFQRIVKDNKLNDYVKKDFNEENVYTTPTNQINILLEHKFDYDKADSILGKKEKYDSKFQDYYEYEESNRIDIFKRSGKYVKTIAKLLEKKVVDGVKFKDFLNFYCLDFMKKLRTNKTIYVENGKVVVNEEDLMIALEEEVKNNKLLNYLNDKNNSQEKENFINNIFYLILYAAKGEAVEKLLFDIYCDKNFEDLIFRIKNINNLDYEYLKQEIEKIDFNKFLEDGDYKKHVNLNIENLKTYFLENLMLKIKQYFNYEEKFKEYCNRHFNDFLDKLLLEKGTKIFAVDEEKEDTSSNCYIIKRIVKVTDSLKDKIKYEIMNNEVLYNALKDSDAEYMVFNMFIKKLNEYVNNVNSSKEEFSKHFLRAYYLKDFNNFYQNLKRKAPVKLDESGQITFKESAVKLIESEILKNQNLSIFKSSDTKEQEIKFKVEDIKNKILKNVEPIFEKDFFKPAMSLYKYFNFERFINRLKNEKHIWFDKEWNIEIKDKDAVINNEIETDKYLKDFNDEQVNKFSTAMKENILKLLAEDLQQKYKKIKGKVDYIFKLYLSYGLYENFYENLIKEGIIKKENDSESVVDEENLITKIVEETNNIYESHIKTNKENESLNYGEGLKNYNKTIKLLKYFINNEQEEEFKAKNKIIPYSSQEGKYYFAKNLYDKTHEFENEKSLDLICKNYFEEYLEWAKKNQNFNSYNNSIEISKNDLDNKLRKDNNILENEFPKENIFSRIKNYINNYIKEENNKVDYIVNKVLEEYCKQYFKDFVKNLMQCGAIFKVKEKYEIEDKILEKAIEDNIKKDSILKYKKQNYSEKEYEDILKQLLKERVKQYVNFKNKIHEYKENGIKKFLEALETNKVIYLDIKKEKKYLLYEEKLREEIEKEINNSIYLNEYNKKESLEYREIFEYITNFVKESVQQKNKYLKYSYDYAWQYYNYMHFYDLINKLRKESIICIPKDKEDAKICFNNETVNIAIKADLEKRKYLKKFKTDEEINKIINGIYNRVKEHVECLNSNENKYLSFIFSSYCDKHFKDFIAELKQEKLIYFQESSKTYVVEETVTKNSTTKLEDKILEEINSKLFKDFEKELDYKFKDKGKQKATKGLKEMFNKKINAYIEYENKRIKRNIKKNNIIKEQVNK